MDRHTRATNDVRVKKKLVAWLKGIGDVLRIFDNLPEDQIRDVTKDQDIYLLFNVIHHLLWIRKFYPIEGEAKKPDDWQVVVDENIKRPAVNSDIIRASLLGYYIDNLESFHGRHNPVSIVDSLEKMDANPHFHDRVTEDERKAIKRLKQAREEFYREIGLSPEEASEKAE